MVDQLGSEFDFRVVTADRDLGDLSAYVGVEVNSWNVCGRAQVFYRSPGPPGWSALLEQLATIDYDLIYLNSLFGTDAALRPLLYRRLGRLLRRPVLLAPRGELNVGALQLKRLKKKTFLSISRPLGVYSGLFWQGSSAVEADRIALEMTAPHERIFVAPDLTGCATDITSGSAVRSNGHQLHIVFLSRVSPMKNLRQALAVLAQVSRPVSFDIYGPIEDRTYWKECEVAIASLPPHIVVRYGGEVVPADVEKTLSAYDLFFLPTLGENYGHVIREALSAGVPTLISDRTPWRGLAEKGAGADIPLEQPEAFVAWIEAFADLPVSQRAAMRVAARQLGDDPVVAATNLEANRSMFHQILGSRAG
ncbi:glycosyltransferase [Kaistia sp. UC242_56]|uniref:glycosyltransferase n=1 Tax=Kaistia sp. UC242_56 TaxID=3374625 RepID=UPI0037B8FE19